MMGNLAEQVEMIIEQQRSYFYSSQTKNIQFRKEQLIKLKDSIKKYEKEVLRALKLDLNKSEFEAYSNEIGIVLESIQFMLKNIDDWAKPVVVKTPLHFQPGKSFIVREPYGVVLIIAPFNYPFQLVMEPLIGAIIGGNTSIIKPSEYSVHTTAIIKKIIEETFEPHYVRVVEGEKEEVTALIHASFDYIFFTGSVAVGKVVMRAAAERLTPITLELGGKSPTIVDQTANIDVAVKRIAWGKFNNTGQTCVAPDYVLVHKSIYDKFVHKLKKTIVEFFGNEAKQSADYGRIINERQWQRLARLLQLEKENITFGGQVDESNRYIEPTIIEHINWSSEIMEDEIFGPLLPIIEYEDLRIAIQQIRKMSQTTCCLFFL